MEFQNAKFSDDVSSRAIYVLGSNVFRLLQIPVVPHEAVPEVSKK